MFLRPHLVIPLSSRHQPRAGSAPSSHSSSPTVTDRRSKGKKKRHGDDSAASASASPSPSPVQASSSTSSRAASPAIPRAAAMKVGELDKSSAMGFLASFDQQLTLSKSIASKIESRVEEHVDQL